MVACMLLFANKGIAQINYSEDFEGDSFDWTDEDFFTVDTLACGGEVFFGGNSYTYFGFTETAATTAVIGVSNGQAATLAYSYKLLHYDDASAVPNTPAWGTVTVYYAHSLAGPWTTLETITPENHIESEDCAARTVTFTPTGGTVYLRYEVVADPDAEELDFIFFVDDITVTQAPSVACAGAPDTAATIAVSTNICNGQTASLSLSPVYVATGLTFQWQTSLDGETYTDVAANGTSDTYTGTQTESTYYRAVITCTASGEFVNSTAVRVVNTGLDCPCSVVFEDNTEPITRVVFAGIDNASSEVLNATPAQEDFTSVTPAEVTQGETYPIALEGNSDGDFENFFTVFFDFNHDGDFSDDGETFEIGSIENSTGTDGQQATGSIVIPADATIGLTAMRVFKLYGESTTEACESEDGFGYGQVEDYLVNVTSSVTGVDSFSAANFKYYPNPVANVLNVSFVKNITGIEVFNLLGQKVISQTVNQNTAQVNLSSLSAGTYMVKVAADGATKTVKVIKQ